MMQGIKEQVIVVDENDRETGTEGKLEAHRNATLHRAISVFVLNNHNHVLLQQRANGKYHSAGLWSNTCCSHPMPGEETAAAAHRRLKEEMGFDCELEYIFPFRYRADVGGGLTENELDHVFLGRYNGPVKPSPEEVQAHKFVSIKQLLELVNEQPGSFTTWFQLALPRFIDYLQQRGLAA
jgi:isopentenyl-diphosphate delta-isomerase